MKTCEILLGPVSISADEIAQTGDTVKLSDGDAEQLARWGIAQIVEKKAANKPADDKSDKTSKTSGDDKSDKPE